MSSQMLEMDDRFQIFRSQMATIRRSLQTGRLPVSMSKHERWLLKRRKKNFKLEDNKLYRCRRSRWVEVITTPSEAYEKMKLVHEADGNHIGISKTKNMIAMKYYWFGMSLDVTDHVSFCQTCQHSEKFKRYLHASSEIMCDPLEVEEDEEMEQSENPASPESIPDIIELPLKRVKIKKHEVREYVTCFVPACKNTTWTAPDKQFLPVPQNKIKKTEWWISVGRKFPMVEHQYYCCEDHFNLQEDATNYLYVKMMGGKLKLKEGVIPHIFPGNEEQVSQEDLLRLLEENLSDSSSLEEDNDVERCEAYTLEPAVKDVEVQTPKLQFKNELSDKWMEFEQETSVLSCMTQYEEQQRRDSSNNSSVPVISDPLGIHQSTSGLGNNDVDHDDDDNEKEEHEDPAALLAAGKATQLMKLLRKYRNENKLSSSPEWKSSLVTRRQFPVNDDPQCMTQTADQHTLFEKSEVLPQQDPFTITIEGVTYRSIFTSQEEALLSNYIVKEVSTKTFITIRVLCNMVYNFCMKYEFACPPAWDVNQSADKEWMQGFMKRHTLIDWKNIFNKHRMKLVEPCNEVGEKLNDGYIILGVVTNEENEDKRPTLCDKIALDHNYALNTIYQP